MKIAFIITALFVSLISCKQKKLTLEQLQKAKWDSLAAGIDYISMENGNSSKNDPIELRIIAMLRPGSKPVGLFSKEVPIEMHHLIADTLQCCLPDSKAGYIRLDFYEILRSSYLKARVYLKDDLGESYTFSADSMTLLDMGGIRYVEFISKEDAKKMYLDDGNADWSKILDANPLPNAIEINLEDKEWTEESLDELKRKILANIPVSIDIEFPGQNKNLSWKDIFFIEYKRR